MQKNSPHAVQSEDADWFGDAASSYVFRPVHYLGSKLRVLAASTPMRNPLWPDVPTMVEAGQQQHPFDSYFALVAPAGLAAEIVARMNKEVAAALAKSEVRDQMLKHGVVARSMPLEGTATYLKDQNTIWKSALQDAGVEPQ